MLKSVWWRCLACLLLLSACSSEPTRTPVPYELANLVHPSGQAQFRYWGDSATSPFSQNYIATVVERQRRAGLLYDDAGQLLPASHLALSGGGEKGAFGAGILNAWTERGDRPEFTVVSGISTGSIISVFAFLGPEYDPALKHFYTETKSQDIYSTKPILSGLLGDSFLDTAPFEQLVRDTITEDIIDQVAAEYRRGRLLLVGTTELDSQRPVIWNMGEIANSQVTNKEALFEDIIIASSSVPAAFPVKLIEVEYQDQQFQELHVDGGVTHQVFLFPEAVLSGQVDHDGRGRPQQVYVIRNAKLQPDFQTTGLSTVDISKRSLSTILKYQGRGDVNAIYMHAKRSLMGFSLAYIEPDFTQPSPQEPFTEGYMAALYQYGYQKMQQHNVWHNSPPQFRHINHELELLHHKLLR
ncbi:patatin-like phospholipase family protein [Motilimonas pumila]|uniref:Patatin-like phospholipase family protein n=1 Tax=Motilimonas pumila TaxID=2303987 RepID=A0A418YE21_9GAMM|nr:patatin-like phospholipase family protein [Motilimonas pumila]RJG47411.1 patatin-like phospholipase family protein [Motilimonas pumila]